MHHRPHADVVVLVVAVLGAQVLHVLILVGAQLRREGHVHDLELGHLLDQLILGDADGVDGVLELHHLLH